jgi:hypothetical protein
MATTAIELEGAESHRASAWASGSRSFKRNISTCVVLSSIASIDSVNPDSATIGTGIWDNRGVFVLIRNDFADTREDADFSLSAFC